jgi:hypothetical protein
VFLFLLPAFFTGLHAIPSRTWKVFKG